MTKEKKKRICESCDYEFRRYEHVNRVKFVGEPESAWRVVCNHCRVSGKWHRLTNQRSR